GGYGRLRQKLAAGVNGQQERRCHTLMAPECGHRLLRIDNHFPVMLGSRRPTRPTHSIPVAPAAQTPAGAIASRRASQLPPDSSLPIPYPPLPPSLPAPPSHFS